MLQDGWLCFILNTIDMLAIIQVFCRPFFAAPFETAAGYYLGDLVGSFDEKFTCEKSRSFRKNDVDIYGSVKSFKSIVQRDLTGVETRLKRSVLMNYIVASREEHKTGFSILTTIELNLLVEFTKFCKRQPPYI